MITFYKCYFLSEKNFHDKYTCICTNKRDRNSFGQMSRSPNQFHFLVTMVTTNMSPLGTVESYDSSTVIWFQSIEWNNGTSLVIGIF